MTRNSELRRELVGNASDRMRMLARSTRQEPNHPVSIDEFDRTRMGIAAKE